MTQTPFESSEDLHIGTVEFISPDEVKVLLDIDAPHSTALNAGSVRAFPRVNGYVLLPSDGCFIVGQVEWLSIERSTFPKRKGVRDFGLIDLPYPLRKMSVGPLGTLARVEGAEERYRFYRGTAALPSVGAAVLLPTERQLRAVIESGARRRVRIGTSPLAADAEVRVDPDRLFGRHLAVLGNTGSGKSCSVAGLLRWSLDAAACSEDKDNSPAHFIVLDPNGEYARAFSEPESTPAARIFRVGAGQGASALRVPMWLWNVSEWLSITQASQKTQKPTLIEALRVVRDGALKPLEDADHELRRFLRTVVAVVRLEKKAGSPWANFPKDKGFFEKLKAWRTSLQSELQRPPGEIATAVAELHTILDRLCDARSGPHPTFTFTRQEVDGVLTAASSAHSALGGEAGSPRPFDADTPRRFTGVSLLRAVEAMAELLGVSEHVETLLVRLRTLLTDGQLMSVVGDDPATTLAGWLADYLGTRQSGDASIHVLDLSLVPSEIVHVVTAVTARITFEALQRFRRATGKLLPTVLVMEEAHTFIRRYSEESEDRNASAICCRVFERIAREGRKFGLGLVLSSQRPSELSPTVLSQCNTFLLHRISNDRDQDLVRRLVPDNLRGLLRELPTLPSQHAVLLGWASELPVLVRIDDLPEEQRPLSDDPDFWSVWTGRDEEGEEVVRPVDWEAIADEWQGMRPPPPTDAPDPPRTPSSEG